MSKAKYVLEVCEFITEKQGDNGWLAQGGGGGSPPAAIRAAASVALVARW